MVKKALFLGLKNNKIEADELYNLNDSTLFSTYTCSKYKPFLLLQNVEERKLHKMIIEIPFDNKNNSHLILANLENRFLKENELASCIRTKYGVDIADESVIIDIPEQISFEIDLPVVKNKTIINFPDSGSLFNHSIVEGFSHSLRKIRVFLPKNIAEKFSENMCKSIKELLF
jgi:hypothetical protein